jgi:FdhD protein
MNSVAPISPQSETVRGSVAVESAFRSAAVDTWKTQYCSVIEEAALTLDIVDIGTYTLMWTPTDHCPGPLGYTTEDGILAEQPFPACLSLATGFLLTEGIVDDLDDIRSMAMCEDNPDIVRIQLHHARQARVHRRNVVMTSSCGLCGGRDSVDAVLATLPCSNSTLRLNSEMLSGLMRDLRARQRLFDHTGGAHAAAIFDATGNLLAVAEDLGRHNALDKVIGECLLRGLPMNGCGLLLSSRISLEMVAKAACAGLEVIAAVSAPTSLAVETAEQCGITLCAFVRGDRLTVFSHFDRLSDQTVD